MAVSTDDGGPRRRVMTDRWAQVKAVFQSALERAPAERASFVRDACGDDAVLRADVESLLDAHNRAGSFAERAAIADFDASSAPGPPVSRVLHGGERLGVYEIVAPLGAGGMGEVYKARDTRLNRTVAIKVLPAHLSADPGVRSRFEREARAIAALNDPHICTLYDVGHDAGIDFLVLEYLEGQTLAERLTKGAMPFDQALTIAIEIATALATAHRYGVVHRDLKPGNVMLTRSGTKLLDFGLARLVPTAQPGAGLSTDATALTLEGTLLGTVPYMAPEQLEGKETDARTDIFALGAVIYEMATGRRAFVGSSQATLIAAILHDEPVAMSDVHPATPPLLEGIVRKCLAKAADDRWQNARDLATALEWVRQGAAMTIGKAGAPHAHPLWWGLGIVFALLVGAVVGSLATRTASPPAGNGVVRFTMFLPPNVTMNDGESPIVSPDGQFVAFAAKSGEGIPQVWIRALDAVDARPVTGTDGAVTPFWSPDSRAIAFFADDKLKRIPITGGVPQTVCDVRSGSDGAWNRDGTILFTPDNWSGLSRVSAAGGQPVAATVVDPGHGDQFHMYPEFLPDGRRFLYLSLAPRPDDSRVYLGTLGSSDRRQIIQGPTRAAYAPSGDLVFVRAKQLLRGRFDPERVALIGDPDLLADDVYVDPGVGTSTFSVAGSVLAYRNSEPLPRRQLTWLDRTGKVTGAVGPAGEWDWPRLARDGKRIVVQRQSDPSSNNDLWLLDVVRGVPTRFTTDPSSEVNPEWEPDGEHHVFASDRSGPMNLFETDAAAAGKETQVLASELLKRPTAWSPDGRYVLYQAKSVRWQVWALPRFGDRKPIVLAANEANNTFATLSPDSRWVAYASDESGQWEVYVQAFPIPSAKIRLSPNGGTTPRWRADGKELFYCRPDPASARRDFASGAEIMASAVDGTGSAFEAAVPAALFSVRVPCHAYDVGPDGQRFLVANPVASTVRSSMTVVVNWPAILRNNK
jgi:Tol biopolymer transport system component